MQLYHEIDQQGCQPGSLELSLSLESGIGDKQPKTFVADPTQMLRNLPQARCEAQKCALSGLKEAAAELGKTSEDKTDAIRAELRVANEKIAELEKANQRNDGDIGEENGRANDKENGDKEKETSRHQTEEVSGTQEQSETYEGKQDAVQLCRLQSQLAKANSKVVSLELEVTELTAKHASMVKEFDSVMATRLKQSERQQSFVADLEAQLEECRDKTRSLTVELHDALEQSSILARSKSDEVNEVNELRAEVLWPHADNLFM